MTNYLSVSGSFFPADLSVQQQMAREFVNSALVKAKKQVKAIIVPHAGWEYSGSVAGVAYRQVSWLRPTKVILVGPCHWAYLNGYVEEIADHSLEVQMPFIKYVLPKTEIMPITYGEIEASDLAREIEKKYDEKTLIIISSDLSHYHPSKEAEEIDKQTIKAILDRNSNGLEKYGEACGMTGILALLEIAKKKNWQPELWNYSHSGNITGDNSRVVGYAAMGFVVK